MFCLLLVLFLLSSFQQTNADNDVPGFIGYDLYLMNNFNVDIVQKNIVFNIDTGGLLFEGEYILNNQSDQISELVFGIPADNIENITVFDKGNIIKTFRRNEKFIMDNYIYEHLPESDKWYTASLWLKANESRLIRIEYNAKIINDNRGIYTFTYTNNIVPLNISASKAYVVFNDFKLYNIIDISNTEIEKMSHNHKAELLFNININGRISNADYEFTDSMSIDRLNFSNSKKLKNIANLYRGKDYEAAIVLCDEYAENPNDANIDINQVKYIKAEAYRKLAKYDNYFEILKLLDLNKLYPIRLKYKIFYDVNEIVNGEAECIDLAIMLKTIQTELNESNEFLSRWMEYSEIDYINKDKVEENSDNEDLEAPLGKFASLKKLKAIKDYFKNNTYIYYILLVIVFFLGFIIGKRKKRKRKSTPYYTLRR